MKYFSHTKLIIKEKSRNTEARVGIGAATEGIISRASLAGEDGSGAADAAVTRDPTVTREASLPEEDASGAASAAAVTRDLTMTSDSADCCTWRRRCS